MPRGTTHYSQFKGLQKIQYANRSSVEGSYGTLCTKYPWLAKMAYLCCEPIRTVQSSCQIKFQLSAIIVMVNDPVVSRCQGSRYCGQLCQS